MAFWTDKQGNKLTAKEFMQRWKQGIESVTPLQSTRSQLMFSYMIIVGLICGIVTSFLALETLWWLVITLCGALGIQILSVIGVYQKYQLLLRISNQFPITEPDILKAGKEVLKDDK